MSEMPKMWTREKDGSFKEVDTSLRRMCKIAKDRLDSPASILNIIYVDNKDCPQPLRDLMKQFVAGDVSKEEMPQRLDALGTS